MRPSPPRASTQATCFDWPGVPLMFSFVDPDGNRFYVSETSARRR
jgi:hypothetical protein